MLDGENELENTGNTGGDGEDISTGNYIPKQRFDQVYGKMKDYETKAKSWAEFGDPGEVRSRLQKLQEWEKAVEEQRRQSAMSDDEKSVAQREAQIKKELAKYAPDHSVIKQLKEEIESLRGEVTRSAMEAVASKASGELSEMLRSSRIDSRYQDVIEEFLFSRMTQEEQMQFASGDFSRMRELFEYELNEGLLSAHKRGPALPVPPVRHRPGGTPPKSAGNKPKTLDEATNDAWAKLSAG